MEGELSFASVPALLPQADALAASGSIDLGRITRVDSAGVAFLLELTRRAQKGGVELRLHNAGPELRSLLEFLEIDGVLKLV